MMQTAFAGRPPRMAKPASRRDFRAGMSQREIQICRSALRFLALVRVASKIKLCNIATVYKFSSPRADTADRDGLPIGHCRAKAVSPRASGEHLPVVGHELEREDMK